ncbi:MAG TPA: DUF1778 domain-containing protein [Blastocatellia bacterium]|nr:DUF1778 domain-containing protein [Blastocatellia bacterium]
MSTITKSDRMQIRIDDFSKNKIERAARYAHKSVSDFVISNVVLAAEKVIEEHDRVTLSEPDWDLFYDAVLNPPKPNKTLRAAFKRYEARQGK